MKVKELIEQLSKLDPELDVAIGYDYGMITKAESLQLLVETNNRYKINSDKNPTTVAICDYD